MLPIFREVFGFQHLVNLNSAKKNFEGIDLGDKEEDKVAFQITSTSTNAKVKYTLKQFVLKGYFKDYQTLYIFILTEKEESYSEKDYSRIIQGKFRFSSKENILDSRDSH